MALTDESAGGIPATMLVGPTGYAGGMPYPVYQSGNSGFGGNGADGWWIILLLLALGGGWGNGFGGGFGGYGNMQLGYDFPWLMNGQQNIQTSTSDGFRDAQLHDSITSVRDGVSALATQLCNCCGDIQMSIANGTAGIQQALCSGFAGTTAAVTGAQNAISQQLYSNELASLNRSFAEQTANAQGFTGVNAGIADLRYTAATEACATRTASATNTRDIIDAQTRGTQAILDKLCALELDGVKSQLAQAQRDNSALQAQLTNARFDASQAAQTATFQLGLNNEVDALYNRLSSCPVPSVPVYGRQPIFQCNQQSCGCGCGSSASF